MRPGISVQYILSFATAIHLDSPRGIAVADDRIYWAEGRVRDSETPILLAKRLTVVGQSAPPKLLVSVRPEIISMEVVRSTVMTRRVPKLVTKMDSSRAGLPAQW